MYADKMTDSMKFAIDETNRRRAKQTAYNQEHGIEPVGIVKAIHDLTERISAPTGVAEERGEYHTGDKKSPAPIPPNELKRLLHELEQQMKEAAKNLEFEKAAILRDQIYDLRNVLADQSNMPPWQKARLLSGELN